MWVRPRWMCSSRYPPALPAASRHRPGEAAEAVHVARGWDAAVHDARELEVLLGKLGDAQETGEA
eukprot:4010140-Alexandrium_andersonii.AAC.1